MKQRQYRSNQGRSPKQQESNEKMMFISCVGLLVIIAVAVVYELIS